MGKMNASHKRNQRTRFDLHHLKIGHKLLLLVVLTGMIPLMLFGGLSIGMAEREIQAEIVKGNTLYSTMTRARIETYFNNREGDARLMAASHIVRDGIAALNTFELDSHQKKQTYGSFRDLMGVALDQYGYTDVFLTNKYGEVVFSMNYDPLDLAPLVVAGDYSRLAFEGKQNWSAPFWNSFIKDNILLLATPVLGRDGNEPIGTLNVVLNQGALDALVQSGVAMLGESGDAYLVNAEGLLLSNPRLGEGMDAAALKLSLESDAARLLAEPLMGEDVSFLLSERYPNHHGMDVMGTLSTLSIGTQQVGLVAEVEIQEALAALMKMRLNLALMVGLFLLGATVGAIALSQTITRPMEGIISLTREIASFNLAPGLLTGKVERTDEIGMLEQSIHTIVVNLREMMLEVETSAQNVARSSGDLSRNARDSALSADGAATAVQAISRGSAEQAVSAVDAFRRTGELSAILSEDDTCIRQMSQTVERVEMVTKEGLSRMGALTVINQQSHEANREVHASILKAGEVSGKIAQASRLIASVADQTNLLALNAAIEAARAGEHGRGFAVVAHEIRVLSEESRNAAHAIHAILNELRNDNEEVAKTVERLLTIADDQLESVRMTGEQYEDIARAIRDISSGMKVLDASRERIDAMRRYVEADVRILSEVSDQNAGMAQQVTLAVEEQTASVGEISDASESLADLASELKSLVGKFKIASDVL